MKQWLLFLFLTIRLLVAETHAEDKVFVYQEDHFGGTNVWSVALTRLKQMPSWKNQEKDPPLPLRKALRIARGWTKSKGPGPGEIFSVRMRGFGSADNSLRFKFVYILNFEVSPYGNHVTCVVLMDGTVVEPEFIGVP